MKAFICYSSYGVTDGVAVTCGQRIIVPFKKVDSIEEMPNMPQWVRLNLSGVMDGFRRVCYMKGPFEEVVAMLRQS